MEHAGDGAMKRAAKLAMRFAVSSSAVDGAVALVGGAELHHMRDVMRLVPGAEVALFDDRRGAEYAGIIRNFQAHHAVVEIAAATRARAEATAGLVLAAAVIKGPRMDFLVEKAAELGAAELLAGDVYARGRARGRRRAACAMAPALRDRGGQAEPCAARATEVIAPLKLGDLIRRLNGGRLCVVLSAGAPLGAVLPRGPRARAAAAAVRARGRFHGRGAGGSAGGRLSFRGTGRAAPAQ